MTYDLRISTGAGGGGVGGIDTLGSRATRARGGNDCAGGGGFGTSSPFGSGVTGRYKLYGAVHSNHTRRVSRNPCEQGRRSAGPSTRVGGETIAKQQCMSGSVVWRVTDRVHSRISVR